MNRHEIPRSAHVCDYRTSCTVVDILVVSHEDLIEGVSVQKIRIILFYYIFMIISPHERGLLVLFNLHAGWRVTE